ncbi:hypothetical protein [Longibaculum muris]|uniref:hypothetical protein n=1 Tax=Longibaculum muris TaxID=1796628 RepID=UPI003AB43C83
MTEREAKQTLFARLDDCLKVHADLLDSMDIGSIYELQDLAQLHYYLKVEHEFTPAEVEALLSFQDPLEVARWCKEENTHAHSFPICELLEQIDAYREFEPFSTGISPQDKQTELIKRLGQNYFDYQEKLLEQSPETLIKKAGEIAVMQEAYTFLATQFTYEDGMAESMLLLENPLKYFADRWPASLSEVMDLEVWVADDINGIEYSQEYLLQKKQPDSIKERLQQAMKEIKERPAVDKPAHDPGAR